MLQANCLKSYYLCIITGDLGEQVIHISVSDWLIMPVKSELFERPPSIRSGETLKQNVVIQTRSEVLLEEQVTLRMHRDSYSLFH